MHMQSETAIRSNGTRRFTTPTGHKIEAGIPIPDKKSFGEVRGRKPSLSFDAMRIGDSVFFAAKSSIAMTRARTNAYNAAKRANIKSTCRAVDGGLRVWRIA